MSDEVFIAKDSVDAALFELGRVNPQVYRVLFRVSLGMPPLECFKGAVVELARHNEALKKYATELAAAAAPAPFTVVEKPEADSGKDNSGRGVDDDV